MTSSSKLKSLFNIFSCLWDLEWDEKIFRFVPNLGQTSSEAYGDGRISYEVPQSFSFINSPTLPFLSEKYIICEENAKFGGEGQKSLYTYKMKKENIEKYCETCHSSENEPETIG